MLRIIDNKRVELTDSEWKIYHKICKSYDRRNFSGKDLFKGLFETDENGIIICLIPPISKYSSMEVFMFLASVMIHQHLGLAVRQTDSLAEEMRVKMSQLDKRMAEMDKIIAKGNELIKEAAK